MDKPETALLRNANVLDVAEGRILADRSILIRDGRIAEIDGPKAAAPADARVIDLRGLTLMPGLCDAHVHLNTFPSNQEEHERAKHVMNDLAYPVVELGGTVGAEHGLGKRKAHLLELQYTRDQIEAMKQVKRRLDPQWLLGQGTLFPV